MRAHVGGKAVRLQTAKLILGRCGNHNENEHRQDTSSKPKGLAGVLVAKAPDLVNYQDGAVVSREIVKKPTGNVTLFALLAWPWFTSGAGEARDAMADAEATFYLCRLVMERAPAVWSSSMRFSKKATVAHYISEERVFCLTDFYYSKPYSCLVTPLGQNQKNTAEWFVYDLSVDPAVLQELGDEPLAARLAELPWPVRRLKANAAPMIFPVDEAPPCCAGLELGADETEGRANRLHKHPELCQRLVGFSEALRDDFPPSPHVEKQIYDGFFEKSDEVLIDSFHAAKWERRRG